MNHVTFKLETLTCPSCVNKIEKALNQKAGVKEVNVFFTSSKVKVTYDETISIDDLSYVIERLGFNILSQTNR